MLLRRPNLDRLDRLIEEGERRIADQEDRIERMCADGYPIEGAEEVLRAMRGLRALQLKLREDMKRWLN